MEASGAEETAGRSTSCAQSRLGELEPLVKLLLLVHQPIDSGADMPRAIALGRELQRHGHQVTLLCEGPTRELPAPDCEFKLVCAPRTAPAGLAVRGLHPASLLWRANWLREQTFHLVHTFGVRPSVVLPAWWLHVRGTFWVADWSDFWGWGGIGGQRGALAKLTVGTLDSVLERLSRAHADGVSVVSSYLARLGRSWGLSQGEVLLLGGGADVEAIRPIERERARESLDLGHKGPVFVFSGRSRFDLKIVGETFRQIRRQLQDARLFLLGGSSRRDLGLRREEGVIDWGFLALAKMAQVIAAGDVMLLPLPDAPFNRARFPNRLGDYMAAARPVVTNPTGDVGRTVTESGAGLVVGESPEELAAAALALCDDRDKAREMGRRGRRYAEQMLAWSRLADRLNAFYSRIMTGPQ